MFFFVLAVGVQVLLLFECLLQRVVACLLPSNKSKLGQYADKSMIATKLSGFSQVFALPLQMLSSAASVSLGMLVVFCIVAVLSVVLAEYTPSMLTFVRRAYNQSVAPVVNTVLELSVLVNGLFRFLLPVYNALVYVPLQIMEQVVGPLAWQYAEKISRHDCELLAGRDGVGAVAGGVHQAPRQVLAWGGGGVWGCGVVREQLRGVRCQLLCEPRVPDGGRDDDRRVCAAGAWECA